MAVAVPLITGAVGQAVATNLAWTVASNYAISTTMFSAITSLGGALGAALGAAIISPGLPDVEGPRALEGMNQVSTYGAFIEVPYGRVRMAGNIIWSKGIREEKTTTEVGGKGGGGGGTVTNYAYYCTWALALCEGKVKEIHKVWFDADLVYTSAPVINLVAVAITGPQTTSSVVANFGAIPATEFTAELVQNTDNCYVLGTGADFGKVFLTADGVTYWSNILAAQQSEEFTGAASAMPNISIKFTVGTEQYSLTVGIPTTNGFSTNPAPAQAQTFVSSIKNYEDKVTVYYGDEDQAVNPIMEAAEGIGNVPAYRGICYILFEDIELNDWGNRIPNITVELSRFPDSGVTSNIYPLDMDIDGYQLVVNYVSGEFKPGPGILDAYDISGTPLSGQFRTPTILYSMQDEAYDVSGQPVSGLFRSVVLSTSMADEAYDTSSSALGGSFISPVIQTSIPDEAYDISATALGGTFT